MNKTTLLIIKMIVRDIEKTLQEPHPELKGFVMGLGLALTHCYEAVSQRQGAKLTPKELFQWAKDLPWTEGEVKFE